MEFDLYVEMMDEQGISQKERIHKSLDDYAALDGGQSRQHLNYKFDKIMYGMKEKQDKAIEGHKDRYDKIEKQFKNVIQKYPGSQSRKGGRKNKQFMA